MIQIRQRLTDRINRARVELELRRAARPAIVVLACMGVGLFLLGYMLSKVAPSTFAPSYDAQFAVSDATAVTPNVNEVRYKGIPVGTIKKIEVEGDQPVIKAKIKDKYGRIYRDAQARLRPSTALQDMYLDIVDRGSKAAGELPEDEPLPETQTAVPVSIGEVLDVFQPSQRLRLRTLLDDLGNGMKDRGRSLQAIFVELAPFVQAAGEISQQLGDREPLVRRLVHNTAQLTRELGQRELALRKLLREGSATFATVRDGRADLDATLRELAPTLAAVQTGFAGVRGTLDDVDAAVRSLYPVADELPESLDGLKRLSDDASPAIAALRAPVGDLVPFARSLRPLPADLDSAVQELSPQIDTVNKVTSTLAACKKGVQNFFQWNASISKFGDARGPIPRGNVVLGAQSSSLFNDPNEYAPQACAPGKIIGGRVPTEKDKH